VSDVGLENWNPRMIRWIRRNSMTTRGGDRAQPAPPRRFRQILDGGLGMVSRSSAKRWVLKGASPPRASIRTDIRVSPRTIYIHQIWKETCLR